MRIEISRRSFLKATGAVSAAALMAACGGSSNTASSTAPAASTSASAAAGGDHSNDVITYGLTQAWDTVNPYGSSSGSIYQQLVSDKLYDRLAFVEEQGSGVTPRGAESWENTDDGMAALFHLDKNAKWHDGEPVTAKDWVWTAQLITNPKYDFGLRSEFNTWAGTDDGGVETAEKSVGLEAVDDYTLKMTFKTVTPVEDWLLLHNKYFYVLPEHLLSGIAVDQLKTDDFWKAPIGCGPCTFISETAGSEMELGTFADYHLGAPKFGKLILKVVSASNTITSVAAGEMDAFFQGPSMDDALAAKDLGMDVEEAANPTNVAVFLINNQNVPDKRIRQAMSYAIDKDLLIEQNMHGNAVASATCIIPGSEYDSGLTWKRDVEKAKSLLAEAGWDGHTLQMVVTSARESMAAVIQQNLADAGITIEVQTVELATMFSGLQDGTYDLGICGSNAMVYPLWMSGYYDYRNATYCQISDPSFAELQDAIAAEIDPAKKKEMVNEYQDLLVDEMPLVILYHGYGYGVKSERLQGFNAFEGGVNNEKTWNWYIQ